MAKQTKKSYPKVGSVWKDETGRLSLSLKLAETATLKIQQGDKVVEVKLVPNKKGNAYLWFQKPVDELSALVDNGYISEEIAEQRYEALPKGLEYQVIVPPSRD